MFDEIFEERAAIKEFDGGMDRAEAEAQTRAEMHECEVRSCIRRFYPNGNAAAAHFNLIEKRRGKEAADKLRVDVRSAWVVKRRELEGRA